MTQFSYTAEAWTTLTKNPVDRSVALKALVEKMGGRFIALHYSMGEYDGMTVYEAPDAKAAAAAVLAALTPGHIKDIKTTPLFTTEEIMDVMRQAGSATYQGPSAS